MSSWPAADSISPATAGHPVEALEMLGQALSDGDLMAAVALHEPAAVVRLTPDVEATGADAVGIVLSRLLAPRLRLEVHVRSALLRDNLALVTVDRSMRGTSIEGTKLDIAGTGAAILHQDGEFGWRLLADDWALSAWL
ncbi:MAG TPA: hypothetical protein VME46_04520 [Acidimicrobiales bacterium]|nr:hypothetical protein [Acidimicrobiales bacterium]